MVRQQEEEQDDRESCVFTRITQDHHSSDEEHQSNSSPSVARITKINAPIAKAQPVAPSEAPKSNTPISRGTKLSNARAILVSRPRAVLSSPENDRVIGNINKLDSQRSSSSKKLRPREKVPAQTTAISIPIKGSTARSPLGTRKGSRDASGNKSDLTHSKSPKSVAVPRRILSLKKEIKSNSTEI